MSLARGRGPDDAGSAVIEFLAVTLLLLVPIVYLVLVLGRLQAATFAAEGAAREAGRAFTTAVGPDEGSRQAVAAVHLALSDQGFAAVDRELDGLAVVEVRVTAPLPVAGLLGLVGTLTVTGHALREVP